MTQLSVDPPDLGFWPTVRRLLRLWRAEWRLAAVGLTCAFLVTVLSIAIPRTIQLIIDDHVVPKDRDGLGTALLVLLGLALARFVLAFTRRFATARIGIRIEAEMRRRMYAAYLGYPRAFYDRHATGQVVSRATNDLYPIRYFIGWGLVQGAQSLMMLVGAGIVPVGWRS